MITEYLGPKLNEMIEIIPCDFQMASHRNALIKLMNHYMEDEMGNVPPLNRENAELMVEGLKKHPSKLVFLATCENKFVGLITCFINFSTFLVKPFINVHDVVVLNDYRGKGIGNKMMEAVIEFANENNYGKITLEVREDNIRAQQLYRNLGFAESHPPMHFWTKYLE